MLLVIVECYYSWTLRFTPLCFKHMRIRTSWLVQFFEIIGCPKHHISKNGGSIWRIWNIQISLFFGRHLTLKIFPPFVENALVRRKRKKREEWKEKGKRHGHNSLLYHTSWVLLTLMSVHVFKHVEINRSGSHDLCEHHVHICIHKSVHRKSAKPKCRTKPAPTPSF